MGNSKSQAFARTSQDKMSGVGKVRQLLHEKLRMCAIYVAYKSNQCFRLHMLSVPKYSRNSNAPSFWKYGSGNEEGPWTGTQLLHHYQRISEVHAHIKIA